jgi:HlyD family secretion protein
LRAQAPPTEQEIAAAEAAVHEAQAQLDLIAAGSRPEDIAAAQADVSRAETELLQAQLALADRELRAPFAGTVASLDLRLGQQVTEGMPVLHLADTSGWLIETTDLTELDVVEVTEGARVTVEVDALPDVQFTGSVRSVRPMGESDPLEVGIASDVTYKVTITLDEADPRLRWNMTAAVAFE